MIDFENGETKVVKWITGKYKVPVTIDRRDDRLWLQFAYNPAILEHIKSSFSKYKWHGFETPPRKQWSVEYNYHNLFRLDYHVGGNPYSLYDQPLITITTDKPARAHQLDMASHIVTHKRVDIAGEMGVGKTLAAIIAAEHIQPDGLLWVAPKSALYSVQLEFRKWKSNIKTDYVTYSSLKRLVENWPQGKKVYQMIVFDESHNVKTPTAQRSKAAMYLADHVRREWGDNGYLVLMTGTPAPKSPIDWYYQAEIACPGYLKEGDQFKFKERLGIIQERENVVTGGTFPQLITWLDDERKCTKCGEFEDHYNHHQPDQPSDHAFMPSKNEVKFLYERMKGLVQIKFKKDCVDLPDKYYKTLKCKTSRELENAAKLIANRSPTTIKALTLLRELSDGFQYEEKADGQEECPACQGTKVLNQPEYIGPEVTQQQIEELGYYYEPGVEVPYHDIYPSSIHPEYYKFTQQACPNCKGTGEVIKYVRTTTEVKCPKDDILRDLLDEYSDVGRVVIYAGFTGSIDRCVNILKGQKWDVIRVDGRGWAGDFDCPATDMLDIFQNRQIDHPRVAFIGHPGSAGQGLTLTASPVVIYFSNDFSAVARQQSEDRIHRIGMDENRGATIVDIVNLPTDKYVIDNLKQKKDLQSLSLGQVTESLLRKIDDDELYS